MSVWCLRKLVKQEHALQSRSEVPKRKVKEVIEIKDEVEKGVVHEDPRPVKRSRRD